MNQHKNLAILIKTLIGSGLILVASIVTSPLVVAHGGGGEEYNFSGIEVEEVEEKTSNKNFLPYAIGGSILIVGGVAGLAVWQRRKNS
jgi:hypothetical protein